MDSFPASADAVLDAYGRSCGELEPLLWRNMRQIRHGQILEVRSDFPATREGVPSWCWLTGHALVAMVIDDLASTRFFLRKQVTRTPSDP